jgi:VIT1/CCC1 family predicted Fe2+/Mn2+ transporter
MDETGAPPSLLHSFGDGTYGAEPYGSLVMGLDVLFYGTTRKGGLHDDGTIFTIVVVPEPPARASLRRDDWLGAAGVALLVFLSTIPVALPFVFMQNAGPAMRVSNAIAILMLFGTGYAFGRITGRHPLRVGLVMVVLGGFLMGLTIALGG